MIENIEVPDAMLEAIKKERERLGSQMVQLTDEQIVLIVLRWQLENPFIPLCSLRTIETIQ